VRGQLYHIPLGSGSVSYECVEQAPNNNCIGPLADFVKRGFEFNYRYLAIAYGTFFLIAVPPLLDPTPQYVTCNHQRPRRSFANSKKTTKKSGRKRQQERTTEPLTSVTTKTHAAGPRFGCEDNRCGRWGGDFYTRCQQTLSRAAGASQTFKGNTEEWVQMG
jgi:hypothetical protein